MDMVIVDESRICKNPLVSVRVHSYNQDQYIKECLDSVLSQKTDFEYEIVLANNPSEDQTRDICIQYQKQYPDKIRLLLREKNMGFFANFFETGRMCRGKYIARCDADDYWCDELKLQKQVDLLESDNSIGMCYTHFKSYEEETKSFEVGKPLPYNGIETMFIKEPIATLTIMHRRELYLKYIKDINPQNHNWLMEDTPINLWYSLNSKIIGIEDLTSVYRIIKGSISHPISYDKQKKFNKSLLDIRLFFFRRYHIDNDKLLKNIYRDYYWRNIASARNSKQYGEYLKNILISQYWKYKPI